MPSGALQRGQQLAGGVASAAARIIERRRYPRPMTALFDSMPVVPRVCLCGSVQRVARTTAGRAGFAATQIRRNHEDNRPREGAHDRVPDGDAPCDDVRRCREKVLPLRFSCPRPSISGHSWTRQAPRGES